MPATAPGLFRNYVSYVGAAVAGFVSIVLMVLLELTSGEGHHNPYVGIFTYIIFPTVMGFGLLLIPAGMLWERRRRRRLAPDETGRFPVLDLNDPRRRRSVAAFLLLTFVFLFMSAFGSYRAFEHTESVSFCGQTCHEVMKPEFTAYLASPHARVKCVECHVGPGADWYVRSKLSGAYQLYSVTFNKFSRPIQTPVHNMRPARDTCEQCHWPGKFHGAQLKVFNRFAYDEANTRNQTRLLINTGGGSPDAGEAAGIHWHMNIANEITYVSSDEQRQVIPWVQMRGRDGSVTEFFAEGETVAPERLAGTAKRRMDCVDCHNRPSHIYVPPDRAVNDALAAGRLDASLPFLKRQAVEALTGDYATTEQGLAAIASRLDAFYRSNYPEVHAAKGGEIRRATAELQRIFQTYIFPEMKTDWRTHPDNAGHYYSQGCFRCHDGKHKSPAGQVIRSDCNICHTLLDQSAAGRAVAAKGGEFRHPVDLGDLAVLHCNDCHKGGRPFNHPVNLGDISEFQCAQCHKTGKPVSRDWLLNRRSMR
ncbi:MAG TPA: NapC/NirT family cytochrome c [Pyrinomonadaceae bacterium]|nr:NapC/NirT family cytochrome c [Pyrinomonadaceae bacterium]